MRKINFTKRAIESMPVPSGEHYIIFRDTTTRGLGIKIEPSGRKTYFWSRKALGKATWQTIGDVADIALDEARARASSHNIDRERMKVTGEDVFAKPSAVTLGHVITEYVARRIKLESSNPDRAVKDIEGQRDRNLKNLVDRKVASIRKPELLALRETVHKKRGPCASNRLLNMLRAAINFAIETEIWKGENPALGIPVFKEHQRRRFLYKDELDRLRLALDRTPNRDLKDFVRLALMTGARKSDITGMKFSDVALDAGTWLVRAPKNEVPYRIALTGAAVEILCMRQSLDPSGVWVFPSNSRSGHIMDMKRSWGQLLKRAAITDVHQHDLRRTLGSWAAAGGASLLVIGKALGHTSTKATQIYAQMDLDPVRATVESATRAMFADVKPTATALPEPKLLPAAPQRKKLARHG